MKNILIALPLLLASCASSAPGSVPISADGPVVRTIERVLQRTEGYLAAEQPPLEIPDEVRGPIEASIQTARAMTSLPEASGDLLLVTMRALMNLHDALVLADPALDQLEREVYLEDTARLRSLFESVNIHASLEPVLR